MIQSHTSRFLHLLDDIYILRYYLLSMEINNIRKKINTAILYSLIIEPVKKTWIYFPALAWCLRMQGCLGGNKEKKYRDKMQERTRNTVFFREREVSPALSFFSDIQFSSPRLFSSLFLSEARNLILWHRNSSRGVVSASSAQTTAIGESKSSGAVATIYKSRKINSQTTMQPRYFFFTIFPPHSIFSLFPWKWRRPKNKEERIHFADTFWLPIFLLSCSSCYNCTCVKLRALYSF